MSNAKEFIATNSIQFVNDANKNLIGTTSIDASGQLVFTDEFTTNTYKFDQPDSKIKNLTLKELADFPQGITVDDLGQISFTDTKTAAYLNNIVTDIDVIQLLDKLNTIGSIYDFRIKQMTFGDYKYANVKFCTDIANTFGYFSIDKLLNDERSRQIFQNDQAAIYKGTAQEALFPPYAGMLADQNYQVNGWVNIDYLVHLALANDFGYDDAASFSVRTKPFQDSKRVIIMMVLNYVNDMFSLGSFNKLSDFGVRIVDRNTDQEIDLSYVQTNIIGQVGTNILSTYVGPLKYDLTRIYDVNVPHEKALDVNKCDKKYINKCDGVIFTLKNEPEKEDAGCPECYRHEIAVEVRINPHADLRINKLDIQNTIDPIHWTTGLVTETCYTSGERTSHYKSTNYDTFKNLVDEFGEKSYTVGRLNESRAFAAGAGDILYGLIAGGFSHEENQATRQVSSTEGWNGTSWCTIQNAEMPQGRSLGLMGGSYKQAVYAFGTSNLPPSTSLHNEISTIIWNGSSWFTASPYTITQPNIPRHSAGGKLDVQIIITDENKSPIKSKEEFMPHTLFNDNFLMRDTDFYKLVAVQNPNQDTNWYALTRFDGFVFGGRTDTSVDLFNATNSTVTDIFEFVSWGGLTRYTYNISGSSTASDQAGTWMVDSTRNYPVKAYGVCYVGNTVKGLATGGKTGKSPSELLNAYIYPVTYEEFESPILNLSYEYNGITWIRRDNLPEAVYYHAGVGDINNSIYWGGIHGSTEQPHIYDSLETFEDWEVIVSRFGGSNHRSGTFGLDGSLRYSLFPTRLSDGKNEWFQLGDPRDYTSVTKPLLCTTDISATYASFNPALVNTIIGNDHTIKISKLIDSATIQSTTYFDGEAWKSKVIYAGNEKLKAYGESNDYVGKFDYINEHDTAETYRGNYIKKPDGTISDAFVPTSVFAERYNITNSLNSDYAGHTVKGGMWLWSRPTVGENLFHPDNLLKPTGTDVTSHDVVYDYISHSFNPTVFGEVSGNTLHSFFVDYDLDHVIGLDQMVWEKKILVNELTFIEKWSMPNKFEQFFTTGSSISGLNLLINGSIVPATSFPYRKSTSYNRFITPLNDMVAVNSVTNVSELHKFIDVQFRTLETDPTENTFVYNLQPFITWTNNPSGKNFHPVSYDGFKQFFTENDGEKITVSNAIRSSSVRDKATLFPWADLLGGDATGRAKKGSVTWNWIRELVSENGLAKYATMFIVAETIFAGLIYPGRYIKPDGTQAQSTSTFWREIFKISKFDKNGTEIWSYEITYDESDSMPEINEQPYWINSTLPIIGTLFGTSINNRDLNDGLSTNETYDSDGNKILRTVSLWNSKTINVVNSPIDIVANEQYDMTYIDWKKTVDNTIPLNMYGYKRSDLISMMNDEYNMPTTAVSIAAPSGTLSNWFLCLPGQTFEGMLIADSNLAFNPSTRREYNLDGSYIVYNDVSVPVTGASVGLVKEFISSYSYNVSGTWKITKAFIASPSSHGYISKDYGKSTYTLPPVTNAPIDSGINPDIVKNQINNVFPWNYLSIDPAMFVEMIDSTGYWFAYGDNTNKLITSPSDTHTNIFHIGHVPVANYPALKKLPLGNNIHSNIANIIANGSSSTYRHKEALLELVNTQHGELLFDIFVTMTEGNENKPYGNSVKYYPPPTIVTVVVPSSGSSIASFPFSSSSSSSSSAQPIPETFCCTIQPPKGGCVVECSSSGTPCVISLLTGASIEELDSSSLLCYTNGITANGMPLWELHNHEEWSIPFIESPFSGPFGNSDFNVWVSSGKSDTTRWGNLIFNQVPQDGDLIANFKAHRIGTDTENNKVYLSVLTASINTDEFNKVADDDINIPCRVVYDEYIFPTQFATDTISASGYATLPFINDIIRKKISFKKDPAIFSTEPLMVYIPEKKGCGVTEQNYYTEWGTNFIQEFKDKTTAPTDPVAHKYFFKHDNGFTGSSTHKILPDPNSYKIIETDWRRYQDGVGLGGDIPNIDATNCLPLKQWFIGQTAIGNVNKAIIVGGYIINSGESTLAPDDSSSWWNLFTTNKTFKWDKGIINPEDMYNKNYTKRNFSPFFSNGENSFSNSSLSYVMFDLGKNVNTERRGTVEFFGDTNIVSVIFDEPISEIFTNRNMYSISMTPNNNVKVWWDNKTEKGFDIYCEIKNWTGKVDWSIFYTENLSKDAVETSLNEQDTYDQFRNL
jgi:hypothetical protein